MRRLQLVLILILLVCAGIAVFAWLASAPPPAPDGPQPPKVTVDDPATDSPKPPPAPVVQRATDEDLLTPAREPGSGAPAQAQPIAGRLQIQIEEGTEFSYRVARSHQRTGRFEGGDTTEIDYWLRADRVRQDGSVEIEIAFERIVFRRVGRGPVDVDSDREGGSGLARVVRDLVDRPFRVHVNPRGEVDQIVNFPQPHAAVNGLVVAARARTGGTASSREIHVQRMLAMMVEFIVSPEALLKDLHTIFAASVQGEPLRAGAVYRIDGSGAAAARKGRRLQHPGPVPIYRQGEQPQPSSPLSGGGKKGRGGYALQLGTSDEGAFGFVLLQSHGGRAAAADAESPTVGTATYDRSDGLLQHLAYHYETSFDSPSAPSSLSWQIDIWRR